MVEHCMLLQRQPLLFTLTAVIHVCKIMGCKKGMRYTALKRGSSFSPGVKRVLQGRKKKTKGRDGLSAHKVLQEEE